MIDRIETNEIANNIRILRFIKGIKAETLAKQLGITKSSYSDIETGKTEITLSRLQKIADILNVNYYTILTADKQDIIGDSIAVKRITETDVDLLQEFVNTQKALINLLNKIDRKIQ